MAAIKINLMKIHAHTNVNVVWGCSYKNFSTRKFLIRVSLHENFQIYGVSDSVHACQIFSGQSIISAIWMLLFQDAFSENAQHLQKVLIAYLNKRGKSDPACAVSVVPLLLLTTYMYTQLLSLHLHAHIYVSVCP